MATILITDGEQRAALATVRSLGAAGHRVYVCSARDRSLAGSSRFCSGHATVPDALKEPGPFVAAIKELVARRGVDVLLPMTEPALLSILPRRNEFDGVVVPFVDAERFARICDKAAVMEAARDLGIEVPKQCRLDSPEELPNLLSQDLRFPVVLKPTRSVSGAEGARAKTSVSHIRDAEALRAAIERVPAEAYPLLVQERIVGPGVGVFLLLWGGEPIAAFSHRRIREKPPAGGVSVYRESYRMDPQLLERTRALLAAFDWEGVAMVEYKVDATTGAPYIMEINGRFWGSLQLAIDAGVDFPSLLVSAALGENPEPVLTYSEGIRSRWTLGEIDHLIARFRRSPEELSLPADAPSRAGALRHFLGAFGRSDQDEVLRLTDPMPAIREMLDWAGRR